MHIFGTPFPKNTSGGLLLFINKVLIPANSYIYFPYTHIYFSLYGLFCYFLCSVGQKHLLRFFAKPEAAGRRCS